MSAQLGLSAIVALPAIKLCCRCGQAKPHNEFHVMRNSATGVRGACKVCRSIEGIARLKQRERSTLVKAQRRVAGLKWCPSCELILPITSFSPNSKQIVDDAKRQGRCRMCRNFQRRSRPDDCADRQRDRDRQFWWRQNNPEAARMAELAHTRNRRAKIKGASGRHVSKDIVALWSLQRGKCAHPWCRKRLQKAGYHVDHVVPVFRGGANDRRNLQLLCAPCNLSKGRRHPIDHAIRHGVLV